MIGENLISGVILGLLIGWAAFAIKNDSIDLYFWIKGKLKRESKS